MSVQKFDVKVMKFYKIIPLLVISFFVFQNCKQSEENRWKINLTESKDKVKITDISKDFFDENISLEQFKTNYPWFQGTVSDEDFVKRRKDSAEIAIYKEAISKINLPILERDINLLFS
ncbi:MAG: gliding motility protein GldB, partial [Bergeyella zoohelcum]|nr:gliding motility protein GldB [Bergeyella zoohelcum]